MSVVNETKAAYKDFIRIDKMSKRKAFLCSLGMLPFVVLMRLIDKVYWIYSKGN